MFDIDIWKFIILGIVLFLLIFILLAKGLGVIKLAYLNFKRLNELETFRLSSSDAAYKDALLSIIRQCQALNSKWILEESDLNILNNSYNLIKKIACAYYPNSKFPMEEARIGCVLDAFMELKNHIIILTTGKGVHAITQFRIRHILSLSNAWKKKESYKQPKLLAFLKNYGMYPLFKWIFMIIHFFELIFWAMKMTTFIIQDIIFKLFLVRWYLVIGRLSIQIYSNQAKDSEIKLESLMSDLDSTPESENEQKKNLPETIRKILEFSRSEIVYHTWCVEWVKVKDIYIKLIKNIAHAYHPKSENPIYEVRLSQLLASVVCFSDQIATIRTYPFLDKMLYLKISHILLTKDTASFLKNNQVLSWIREHKLNYIFKYSLLLFKAIKKKHPSLLFKDFTLTLAGEITKRWLYLHLHDKIAMEINTLYREP